MKQDAMARYKMGANNILLDTNFLMGKSKQNLIIANKNCINLI